MLEILLLNMGNTYTNNLLFFHGDVRLPQARIWLPYSPYGCFRKWWYPQIIHFNRVFHYFHHPFWGYPYFWKQPYHGYKQFRHDSTIWKEPINDNQRSTSGRFLLGSEVKNLLICLMFDGYRVFSQGVSYHHSEWKITCQIGIQIQKMG